MLLTGKIGYFIRWFKKLLFLHIPFIEYDNFWFEKIIYTLSAFYNIWIGTLFYKLNYHTLFFFSQTEYVNSKVYPIFPRYTILKDLIKDIMHNPDYMEVCHEVDPV